MAAATDPWVEVRGELLAEHVAILDAVASATPGASRMSVLRDIVAEWVGREVHRSTLVFRVANINGTVPEALRQPTGRRG